MKNWGLKPVPNISAELKALPLNQITRQLLAQRGFFTKDAVERFFNSRYEDLHAADKLSGIPEAVARISLAREKNQPVTIFGDYDADGITATTLMLEALAAMGIEPSTYIPDRNSEGYGLNIKALKYIKKTYKTELLITVDCGISNFEEVEFARKLGMDAIICDHHAIPEKVPQKSILINPKLPSQDYPFQDLAGVGVAFKLASALWKKNLPEKTEQLKWFLDLVAIGTIADCVPLRDENRLFAKFGLMVLQKTKRLGIQEIIKTSRLNIGESNPPTAENIAYQIGPRLNAAGRMDHADLTLNLLTENNPVQARIAALELEKKNSERQKITQQIYSEVKASLLDEKKQSLIIRSGEHWPLGVVGVVAGKISDEFNCPTFILRKSKNLMEGSGRSIDNIDLFAEVEKLEEYLEKYGGHAQAMGIKIKPRQLPVFEKRLRKNIEKKYSAELDQGRYFANIAIDAAKIDWDLFSEIRKFEPFGEGNEEPIFFSDNLVVNEIRRVGSSQAHLKLALYPEGSSGKVFSGIFFRGASEANRELKIGDKIKAAYNLRTNEWNGNHKIELNILAIGH